MRADGSAGGVAPGEEASGGTEGDEELRDRIRGLAKPELHVHLDGSPRPSTMLELARERGVALPETEPEALARHMVPPPGGTLESYLTRFALTIAVMQDADALERIAYELTEDHAREDVRYAEVRFCPALNTRGGLAADQVLDAVLRGLRRAESALGVRAAVIVCALRNLPLEHSVEMAELAVSYRDRGVCGFDLAGAEHGNPVRDHGEAFDTARRHGLPVTIHAGEAFGPDSIRQALDFGGASRIGHGTRLGEDPELLARVRDAGVTLEICLTSNVQTGAARTLGDHPLRGYLDAGLSVTLATDNRLVSGVTLTDEYVKASRELGLTWDELVGVARNGFARAFAPAEVRAQMVGAFDAAL